MTVRLVVEGFEVSSRKDRAISGVVELTWVGCSNLNDNWVLSTGSGGSNSKYL